MYATALDLIDSNVLSGIHSAWRFFCTFAFAWLDLRCKRTLALTIITAVHLSSNFLVGAMTSLFWSASICHLWSLGRLAIRALRQLAPLYCVRWEWLISAGILYGQASNNEEITTPRWLLFCVLCVCPPGAQLKQHHKYFPKWSQSRVFPSNRFKTAFSSYYSSPERTANGLWWFQSTV